MPAMPIRPRPPRPTRSPRPFRSAPSDRPGGTDARRRLGLGLAAALVAAGLLASPAAAQQRWILDDADTWAESSVPRPGTPEASLAAAREAYAQGDLERAEFLATQWIERNEDHPRIAEALLIRADALNDRGEDYRALYDYERIARAHTGSEVFVTALEREYEIAAAYLNGRKRKLWGIRWADATEEGEELMIRIQERLPGSRLAERAGLTLADWYFRERKLDLAAEMYEVFLINHPRSIHADDVRRRLVYSYLAAFKGPEFDATGLGEARARIEELQASSPRVAEAIGADALLTRIEASEANKRLVTARWYLRTGDPVAAELVLRRLIREHPRTAAAAEALRVAADLVGDLPPSVLAEAPDYVAMLEAIRGPAEAGTPATIEESIDAAREAARPDPAAVGGEADEDGGRP